MPDKDSEKADMDSTPMEEANANLEYGVGRMLIGDEKALEDAQEKGKYHFSKEELDHKADPIDQ